MTALRIFMADDHEVIRKALVSLLQAQPNWSICGEAAEGHEAVKKAQRSKPDVVVLDVGMPRLNGLEGTRQLLKTNPEANIGAELLLSFYSFTARRRRSDAPGFFTASFAFPQVFCNLPSTCLTAPFAWFFSSPVHSPT